jgi:hypothetical protein
MISAVLLNTQRPALKERSSTSLSRTVYETPYGQVVFNHDGNKGSGLYACTLHKLSGTRQLLGAIEFNKRTECWQITHLCRTPFYDGIAHLEHTEAVDFLLSQRLA